MVDTLPIEDAIAQVAKFWQSCPFVPYYLDSDCPELWLNPWDLILENYYCDLAKALGMLYTIYFTAHSKETDIELRVYIDPVTKYEYNLVVVDKGKYVLNFHNGDVVNIESINNNLVLKHCYSSMDLKLEEF
jgi:hypothetical protein